MILGVLSLKIYTPELENSNFKHQKVEPETSIFGDDCFYDNSWRNNVVISFGTLSSFLT